MFVIDVGQGDDIPRKRGPGILQSDLLVINKLDLAPHVFVDADGILTEAAQIRGETPVIGCCCKGARVIGVSDIVDMLARDLLFHEVPA
jgi:urease accessory protein